MTRLNKSLSIATLAATALFSSVAFAEQCAVTVDSTDAMQFSTKAITVDKSCDKFTVNLTHSGKLPKNAMGHNWVLSKTADVAAVAGDGIKAGLDNQYLKPNDERVLAYTDIIGGGGKTSVTFDVAKLSGDENYTFFCSFPGHSGIMRGSLTLAP